MNGPLRLLGSWLAAYLTRPLFNYEPYVPVATDRLLALLAPGDVLLVEGNTRVSTAISKIGLGITVPI